MSTSSVQRCFGLRLFPNQQSANGEANGVGISWEPPRGTVSIRAEDLHTGRHHCRVVSMCRSSSRVSWMITRRSQVRSVSFNHPRGQPKIFMAKSSSDPGLCYVLSQCTCSPVIQNVMQIRRTTTFEARILGSASAIPTSPEWSLRVLLRSTEATPG